MKPSGRTRNYTEPVMVKMAPSMLSDVLERAEEGGVTVGQWIRTAIKRQLSSEVTGRMLLAEILALRKYVLSLSEHEKQEIDALVSNVEVIKYALADGAILEGEN
jgi:hypothetical protein